MKQKHHSLVIKATADLLKYWNNNNISPIGVQLNTLQPYFSSPQITKRMMKHVYYVDEIDDLVVDGELEEFLIEKISDTTSFQHFAYCGSMGDLEDAGTVIRKYDGYCWDCDPFMTWYGEIANLSCADVEYKVDCGELPKSFLMESPGAIIVNGNKDWDDQKYPSALDLAEFYESGKNSKLSKEEELKSLSYGLHMLHDMSVPHHVLCTIENGHSEYEEKMLNFWKRIYSERSDIKKTSQLENIISPQVIDLLKNQLNTTTTFKEIGIIAVDLTCERLPGKDIIPSKTKQESIRMTTLAIACTVRALTVY